MSSNKDEDGAEAPSSSVRLTRCRFWGMKPVSAEECGYRYTTSARRDDLEILDALAGARLAESGDRLGALSSPAATGPVVGS